MNLGHAIQVIDQNDPVPPRILPPSPSTVPVVMSTVDTSTVVTSRVVVPVTFYYCHDEVSSYFNCIIMCLINGAL